MKRIISSICFMQICGEIWCFLSKIKKKFLSSETVVYAKEKDKIFCKTKVKACLWGVMHFSWISAKLKKNILCLQEGALFKSFFSFAPHMPGVSSLFFLLVQIYKEKSISVFKKKLIKCWFVFLILRPKWCPLRYKTLPNNVVHMVYIKRLTEAVKTLFRARGPQRARGP